ncbi:hypothetical protein SAMN05428953_116100 [Mesorhizobium muleiense]|uniref:Uncharacterized protein n=1 Tax=Mesorhizobium muleiense TaxID=1004279 RepID=A0A1G9CLT0_9HYPH|nr:hypothetical protein SAMN05428953_116100 [Mesorhizobium muleiense]
MSSTLIDRESGDCQNPRPTSNPKSPRWPFRRANHRDNGRCGWGQSYNHSAMRGRHSLKRQRQKKGVSHSQSQASPKNTEKFAPVRPATLPHEQQSEDSQDRRYQNSATGEDRRTEYRDCEPRRRQCTTERKPRQPRSRPVRQSSDALTVACRSGVLPAALSHVDVSILRAFLLPENIWEKGFATVESQFYRSRRISPRRKQSSNAYS